MALTQKQIERRIKSLGIVCRSLVTFSVHKGQISPHTGETLMNMIEWGDEEEPEEEFDPKQFVKKCEEKLK